MCVSVCVCARAHSVCVSVCMCGVLCALCVCVCLSTETRWQGYLDQISSSVTVYEGCTGDPCQCHGEVIDADLAVWQSRGGIKREDFLAAKTAPIQGVHYQIINHKLYREEKCMFNSR